MHWRGELSLGTAFWGNFIGINFIATCAGTALVWLSARNKEAALVIPFVFWPIVFALTTWQLIGVYRSARWASRRDRNATLPVLAMGGVFLLGGLWVWRALTFAIPQVLATVQILEGSPELPPTAITLLPGGSAIEYDGGLRLGSAGRLEAALAAAPRVTTLFLNSPGGLLAEGEEMAELVRLRHLDVYVDKLCASAAVLPFLAGRERIVGGTAQVGFHCVYLPLLKRTLPNDVTETALRERGASEAFITTVSQTPPDKLYIPTPKELLSEHLATRVTDGLDFPVDAVDLAALNEGWFKDQLTKDELTAALAEGSPELFAAYCKEAVAKLRQGATVGSVLPGVRALRDRVLVEAARAPGYQALDKRIDRDIALLSYNKDYTPRQALAVFFGFLDVSKMTEEQRNRTIAYYPQEQDRAFMIELLRDPRNPAGPPNSGERARLKEILAKYSSAIRLDDLGHSIPEDDYAARDVSVAWAQALVEIRAKPEEERWPLEAYLYEGPPKT